MNQYVIHLNKKQFVLLIIQKQHQLKKDHNHNII